MKKNKKIKFFIVFFFLLSNSIFPNNIFNIAHDWELSVVQDLDNECGLELEKKCPQINRPQSLPINISAMPDYEGFRGTFILRNKFPAALNDMIKKGIPIALQIPMVSNVAIFRVNENIVAQVGLQKPYVPGLFKQHKIIDLNSQILNKDENNISIELYTPDYYPLHIAGSKLLVGSGQEIFQNFYHNEIIQVIFLTIYLTVALYHLLLAIHRPKDLHNLFFGLFTILASMYWFFYIGSRDTIFGDAQVLRTKIEYIVVFNLPALMLLFLQQYFNKKINKIGKYYFAGTVTLSVIALLTAYPIMRMTLRIWQLSLPIIGTYMVYFIFRKALEKNIDAKYLLLGIVILAIGAFIDLLIAINVLEIPRVGQYSFLIFVIGIAGILANRFMIVQNEVEDLNRNLENKVIDRTKKLSDSFAKINELKKMQDGDYFLTSLLLDPLGKKNISSNLTSVEFFAEQKKKFSFRKWKKEIGGDINIAHTIFLQERKFTFFVNSDAMGKSLQGAGGALVTGAITNAIIERTLDSATQQTMPPEQWLKNAFLELHRVFEEFGGSMLISVFMGLLDDFSGTLYFINAEHPNAVILRDNRCHFIGAEFTLRKIGTMGIDSPIFIQKIKLQPADVLIMGSDGRDDLFIEDQDGSTIMNEDEKLFIKNVETSKGDIDAIVKRIRETGEISDDLSLIRLGYREKIEDSVLNEEEKKLANALQSKLKNNDIESFFNLYSSIPSERVILFFDSLDNSMTEAFIKQYKHGHYSIAKKMVEGLLLMDPSKNKNLYRYSRVLIKLKEIKNALEPAERLFLREPKNIKNLLQLAALYFSVGNKNRAKKIVNMAASVDPKNEKVNEFLRKLAD